MLNDRERREYARLRAKGWHAPQALSGARTNVRFTEAVDRGEVLLFHEQDQYIEIDDIIGDTSDMRPSAAKKYQKTVCDLIDSWGVCTIVSLARTAADRDPNRAQRTGMSQRGFDYASSIQDLEKRGFVVVDSCGGFIGNDLHDNGYDIDLKEAALDAYAEHEKRRLELHSLSTMELIERVHFTKSMEASAIITRGAEEMLSFLLYR